MKIKKRILSILLAISMLFCSLPVFVQAEENFQLEAPTIEITTDKSTYGAFETAIVTVKVYPTDGCPIENVNVEASLNNQLCSFANNQFSAETKALQSEGIEYSFNVVVSKKASGLNFFQKFVLFFKRLFTKTITVTGNTFEDGRDLTSAEQEIKFGSAKGLISVNVWYDGTVENVDSDKDGLIDYLERVYGTNPNLADTDSDGLSDYDEFVNVGTDPTLADSDGNGINDYNDDNDGDGLSNGYELTLGSNANSDDTDCDGLKDNDEVNNSKTSPVKEDTDGDGATDGWEVENGFNPKSKNSSFNVTVNCKNDSVTASVKVSTNGKTAESITIEPIKSNSLINETIPGYLGSAFEFNAEGNLGVVEISFTMDSLEKTNPSMQPTIYCMNEEKQQFYEMETEIVGNTAKTTSTHFSKYILLDKSDFSSYIKTFNNVDFNKNANVDSNNDGISDYVTQLMCNGTIRTGTGALIFGDYTYQQIQSNNDFDGDGILNGDEVTVNQSSTLPDDVVKFNEHFYKLFDIGEYWISAQSYCNSIGGHLCTITSLDEQNFITNQLRSSSKNVYWLGGTCNNKSWYWTTGESFTFSKWGHDEPNNMEGSENYLQIYAKDYRLKYVGDWNDASNMGAEYASDFYSVANTGFICEWDNSDVNLSIILNSSPIKKDTDDDGIYDCKDTAPFEFGLEGGVIGVAKLIADTRKTGHAFISFTSYVKMNLSFSNASAFYDYSEQYNGKPYRHYGNNKNFEVKVIPNQLLTFGLLTDGPTSESSAGEYSESGFMINCEMANGGESYYRDRVSIEQKVTLEQLSNMIDIYQSRDWYNLATNNCSVVATLAWDNAFGCNYSSSLFLVVPTLIPMPMPVPIHLMISNLPDLLAHNLKKTGNYSINAPIQADYFEYCCERCK